MNNKEQFSHYIETVENALKDFFKNHEVNLQDEIYKAMEYSLMVGGKRIRPVLTLAFCNVFGVAEEKALPYAMGLEMIHTYSLIHDDLPCMDDDDLRRGKPSNHKVFGEGKAVLAGDALLNKAFEIMSQAAAKDNSIGGIKAISAVSKLSGTEGMIGGQIIDIETENKQNDYDTILTMYRLKTCALLECSARIAMNLALDNVSEDSEKYKILSKAAVDYTEALGLAFQIRDDILDIIGETETLGKCVGSDEKDNKNTIATLLGVEKAQKVVEDYTNTAIRAAETMGEKADFLKWLALALLERNK